MCVIIYFPDGTEVESVNDFENVFNVEAEKYSDDSYSFLEKIGCLCQLDVDKFIREHPNWKHEFNGDYWMEENYHKLPTT